ncbi:MAG: hypothetical protein CM1200mP37_3930 [Chloroflexota bacterium]|nr:MAG: hypothetical protein CM1200mP37_3930 [Chloroflexota bacterium]
MGYIVKYDKIIIGAGSAGAIIASRLTEDERCSVLLLEAGPDYPTLDKTPDPVKYAYGHDPKFGGWLLGMEQNLGGIIMVEQLINLHQNFSLEAN